MPERNLPRLTLLGVDHTARPTWRLRETVEFLSRQTGFAIGACDLGTWLGANYPS